MKQNNINLLNFTKKLAKESGSYIKKYYEQNIDINFKEEEEMFTNIDLGVEKLVVNKIKKNFPSHNIWSEEMNEINNDSDYTWVIDPLDGTHNYIYHIPIFSASIGLWCKGKPLLGAIYFPMTDELFYAEKGKGAFLNNKKLSVSKDKHKNSLAALSGGFIKFDQETKYLIEIRDSFKDTRYLGCATYNYMLVAKGKAAAAIAVRNKWGDFGASSIIITEAGGKMTTFKNKSINRDCKTLIVSNGVEHKKLVNIFEDIK